MRLLGVGNRYPPWSLGGYETICAGAMSALRASGHRTRVLSTVPDPSDRSGSAGGEADVHRDLRWYWQDHAFPPIKLRASASLERANADTLQRHLEVFAPDAVLWWAMGGMSLSLLEQVRCAGVPAVGVVGDDWMLYGPIVDGWTRRWRGRARVAAALAERLLGVPCRLDLGRAARWVFISEHLRAGAREAGWRLPEATVAHPGIDPRRFAPREPNPWAWRLLYCGRVEHRKGIATAVEALAELPAQATLTIDGAGERAYTAELAALASRLGVGGRVRFQCSPRERIPEVYAAADAVVFPVTWREPWGLVPLEAMGVGRPVLASRAGGGAAEYLVDGSNCLQFEPGNAPALAATLQRLAAAPELRAALGTGGRATAERFTERAFHDALERELLEAIGSGRPPPPRRMSPLLPWPRG